MLHIPGGLHGPDSLRAGSRKLAAGAETAEKLRERRTSRVNALIRDPVVGERPTVTVRISVVWIVNRRDAFGEVGGGFPWRRHDNGRIAECVVRKAFGSQPEKGAVTLDRAAERAAEDVIGGAVEILLSKCSLVESLLLEVRQLAQECVQFARAELV